MNEIFDNYVKQYDLSDSKIKGKWEHSYRVMELANQIAINQHLKKYDIDLSRIIGLFHDIARFYQWTTYRTFDDTISIDHGILGSEILFQQNLIQLLNVKESDYHIIDKAIRNHNQKEVEPNLTQEESMHVNIIRDADKIDIFYIMACLNWSTLTLSKLPVSESVEKYFWNHELIPNEEIKTPNDKIIRILCFLYDLNFSESYSYVMEHEYLEHFEEKFDHSKLLEPYFKEVKRYMKERIKTC